MLDHIKSLVIKKNIEDIYVTGFIDTEDGVARFYPDLRTVYFEINSKYIECKSIDQSSKLKLRILDSIEYNIKVEDDMMLAKSSISEIILNDNMAYGNDVDQIILYNLEDQEEEVICDAMEIKLRNGQMIFLDPTYYFGINIGGEEQKHLWEINLNKNFNVTKTNIKMGE